MSTLILLSYSPTLGQIAGHLSYCLHLLIGFDFIEVGQGGRLHAIGSVGALVVVAV